MVAAAELRGVVEVVHGGIEGGETGVFDERAILAAGEVDLEEVVAGAAGEAGGFGAVVGDDAAVGEEGGKPIGA